MGKRSAPPLQRSALRLVFFKDCIGPSLDRNCAAFVVGEMRYAGAGARCALPTFPTCKFTQLERFIQCTKKQFTTSEMLAVTEAAHRYATFLGKSVVLDLKITQP